MQGEWRKHRARKRLGMAFLLLVGAVVLVPPVYISKTFEGLLQHVPRLLVYLAVCFVWMVVLYLAGWVLTLVLRHHVMRRAQAQMPRNMFDDAMDAIDRIAQGDYDVFVDSDDRFRYGQLGEKINNLARQLSSVEQMRQDFVSNVSHEIQSPLTSITGFAELLKKEDLSEEQRAHYLDVILSEAQRMSRLSDSLLRLSMLDSDSVELQPHPFRVDKQVQSVLLAQEPQWAAKDIQLDIELCDVTVCGDENLLLQVWQNLVQNAIKFTPAGGSIAVRLAQQGEEVVCTVQDSGMGIPQEDLVHIFERFYKVDKARDRSKGGNGLGLPLAKKIVELHGGHIKVESELGAGSTFAVVLPGQNGQTK